NAWFLIDIHNPNGGGQAEGFAKAAKPYDIPYGALVPAGVGGILTSGRCISGTHRAHASYRVMAICMATGEAAGAAAALCVKKAIQPRDLSPDDVRALLAARGVDL
ncbi:MAG: FAD-dependent oxidoreductase, partial [Clostridia bacterium]|nr:FAD-dependent oxidoreductase [Clostridia bacterium]